MAIHDIVVLDNVLAGIEVKAFNFFLGGFQRFTDHPAFQWCVLVNLQSSHDRGDALAAVNPHQLILARYVKLGGARIALAAATPPQLVVDTPGFMTLGAKHK